MCCCVVLVCVVLCVCGVVWEWSMRGTRVPNACLGCMGGCTACSVSVWDAIWPGEGSGVAWPVCCCVVLLCSMCMLGEGESVQVVAWV